jgi:hypothetical protein
MAVLGLDGNIYHKQNNLLKTANKSAVTVQPEKLECQKVSLIDRTNDPNQISGGIRLRPVRLEIL